MQAGGDALVYVLLTQHFTVRSCIQLCWILSGCMTFPFEQQRRLWYQAGRGPPR